MFGVTKDDDEDDNNVSVVSQFFEIVVPSIYIVNQWKVDRR